MNWVGRGDDDGPNKVLHDDDRTKGGVDVFGYEAWWTFYTRKYTLRYRA